MDIVMAHEPLRVSLADLHSAETKGKWWLVGAAWGGDPLVDRQEEIQQTNKKIDSAENILLKLAKKQGMNTDIRRSIFVVLMSSEVSRHSIDSWGALKRFALGLRRCLRAAVTA
jgi:nucleolar MIF4G domain-containing protein 1